MDLATVLLLTRRVDEGITHRHRLLVLDIRRHLMRAHIASLALLGAIVALSAERPYVAAPAPTACSLLTTAQVTAVVGTAMADGTPVTDRGCIWRDPTGKSGKRVTLTILLPHGYETGKTMLAGMQKTGVNGVGDEAFYKYYDEPRYQKIKLVDLDVKKGSSYFGIQVGGVTVDEGKAMAKTLALDILPKL
jgi:hypothetical protein